MEKIRFLFDELFTKNIKIGFVHIFEKKEVYCITLKMYENAIKF